MVGQSGNPVSSCQQPSHSHLARTKATPRSSRTRDSAHSQEHRGKPGSEASRLANSNKPSLVDGVISELPLPRAAPASSTDRSGHDGTNIGTCFRYVAYSGCRV